MLRSICREGDYRNKTLAQSLWRSLKVGRRYGKDSVASRVAMYEMID